MALTITLDPREEARVREEAAKKGLNPEDYVRSLIGGPTDLKGVLEAWENRGPDRLIEVLEELMVEGDPKEQSETWEILRKGLEESRDSNRPFPE